jgi:hypothetical protein
MNWRKREREREKMTTNDDEKDKKTDYLASKTHTRTHTQ